MILQYRERFNIKLKDFLTESRKTLVNPKSLNIARLMSGYDGSKAEREFGLNYRSIEVTLKDTVDWLKERISKGL